MTKTKKILQGCLIYKAGFVFVGYRRSVSAEHMHTEEMNTEHVNMSVHNDNGLTYTLICCTVSLLYFLWQWHIPSNSGRIFYI